MAPEDIEAFLSEQIERAGHQPPPSHQSLEERPLWPGHMDNPGIVAIPLSFLTCYLVSLVTNGRQKQVQGG